MDDDPARHKDALNADDASFLSPPSLLLPRHERHLSQSGTLCGTSWQSVPRSPRRRVKGTRTKDLVRLILRRLPSALPFGKLALGKQIFTEAPPKER
jgi:hypothetical protein